METGFSPEAIFQSGSYITAVPGNDTATVLLVDDNEDFAHAQRRWLEKEYDVRVATAGREGLDAYDEGVDVVVLDRDMPDMSGDEVAETIRNRSGETQILMTTGVEPDTDIIELGIDEYLVKPVDGEELSEHIARALDRARYDDSLQGYFSLANKREVLADQEGVVGTELFAELDATVDELAREQLERREEKLQTLVASAPVAIVTLDAGGRIELWNDAATELFGWEAEEVTGDTPPVFDESDESLQQVRSQLFENERIRDMDLTCVCRDKSTVEVSLSATPLVADGELYGTLFVFVDITERKQRSQQIMVINRVLRHNVRNELNMLMGWLTELDREVSGQAGEYTEKALESARQLETLASDARDIQETLVAEPEVESVNLVAVVREQVAKLRDSRPEAAIEMTLPEEGAEAFAVSRVDDVVSELLENAVVHNANDEPAVRVSLEHVTDESGSWLSLSVADDGPGIPADERTVLFEGIEDDLVHGSGLGLWSVKWLVDRSNGRLSFTSEGIDGEGSTVTVQFRDSRPDRQ